MAKINVEIQLEELEKYFRGENEIAIEFRQHVVEEFARRHLKALVNADLMKAEAEVVRAYTNQQIKENIGTCRYDSVNIAEPLKEKVKDFVKSSIADELNKLVKEAVFQLDLPALVEQQVEHQISIKVADLTTKRDALIGELRKML